MRLLPAFRLGLPVEGPAWAGDLTDNLKTPSGKRAPDTAGMAAARHLTGGC